MKKEMTKTILSLFAGALVLTALTGQAHASGQESECSVVYGGGEICENVTHFTLDKKIQTQTKGGQFVDNLSQNDTTFTPGQQIVFRIITTNTGDTTIEDLDVADILPEELEFVSGPGNYDENSRTLSYRIDRLESGATHENTFVARVVSEDRLDTDKNLICTTNSARAVSQNNSTAEDTSDFCITRSIPTKDVPQVFDTPPVKETPSTGPEMLSLLALIPAGATGLYLRKKSK